MFWRCMKSFPPKIRLLTWNSWIDNNNNLLHNALYYPELQGEETK